MISIYFGILFALMKHIQLIVLNISCVSYAETNFFEKDLVDELNILDLVFIIGSELFASLIKVNIGNDIWVIEDGAFMDCYKIREVNFGIKVALIGRNAFARCHDLKKLNFPDVLFKIGEAAFDSCSPIQQLIIPDLIN